MIAVVEPVQGATCHNSAGALVYSPSIASFSYAAVSACPLHPSKLPLPEGSVAG